MFKDKKWLSKYAGLILSVGLLAGCSVNLDGEHQNTDTEPKTEEVIEAPEAIIESTVVIHIDGVEQKEFTHTFEVAEGKTLIELMAENYKMVEEDGFIKCIEGNGQDEEAGKYWVYDVNGEMGMVGAAEYVLEDGDVVDWKLEVFE